MLGESFIHLLKYRQEDNLSPDITRASLTPSTVNTHGSCTLPEVTDTPAPEKPAPSDVRHVMKHSEAQEPHPSPDLYFCKTCVSLRQSLPSKHVLNDNCQTCPDMQLLSISESQSHPHSMIPQEWHALDWDESAPQQLRFIPEQASIPDNGYMVMDSSIMLNGEPPTNSMINGYLDRKLQEVYSQYLQERLACPGSSPGYSLFPLLPQPSLTQPSQQAYMDLSLDPEARPSQVAPLTTSQGHLSQRASSNFSSPVLRISKAEQLKKPGHSGCLKEDFSETSSDKQFKFNHF